MLTDRLFAGWQVPVSLQMWLERPRLQQKRKQDEPETFLGFEGVYSSSCFALRCLIMQVVLRLRRFMPRFRL